MPSNTEPKTILLKGDPLALEYPVNAAQTVGPGELVALQTNGSVQRGAAGTAIVPLLIAREEDYVGGAIATPFAAGDRCPIWHLKPGDEFYGFVTGAVTVGAGLEAAAAGQFAAGGTNPRLVQALEATAGAGRCRLRAL
jgi:hypothetical protein